MFLPECSEWPSTVVLLFDLFHTNFPILIMGFEKWDLRGLNFWIASPGLVSHSQSH